MDFNCKLEDMNFSSKIWILQLGPRSKEKKKWKLQVFVDLIVVDVILVGCIKSRSDLSKS
jgi:hypothetical protein